MIILEVSQMYTVDITMVITMNLSMCVAALAVLLVLRCSESMKLHDLTTPVKQRLTNISFS